MSKNHLLIGWLVHIFNTELLKLCLKDINVNVLCTSYPPFSITGYTFIKSFLQVNAEKQMNEMKVEGMYVHTVCISNTCICSTYTCMKDNTQATWECVCNKN